MADFKLTENQEKAVYTRGKSVLVSAAAGSGKTSVLARRVSALVEEGNDIRRMLIVTFTNAAAAEMRVRIAKELADRAEAVGDARLFAQSELATTADICTIHRFSIKIIRENFAFLGVDADIRAAGNEECAVFRARAMEQTLETFYEADDEQFLVLRDRYADRTDRKLIELILHTYNFVQSRPEGMLWVKNAGNIDSNAYMAVAREQIRGNIEKLVGLMETCCSLEKEYALPAKQMEKNAADLHMAKALLAAFETEEETYEETLSHCRIERLTRNLTPEELKKTVSDAKSKGRDILRALTAMPLSRIRSRIKNERPYMASLSAALYKIVAVFEERYTALKAEAHIMDYNDMIRLACRALSQEEIAAAYSGRYDYLFVDEYQDTNPIQEALLSRIDPQGGRFMVGDMKQSIYRFRLADPLIFLNKAEQFARDPDRMLLHMNENFRSAPAVIEVVNHIMRRLMSPKLGELAYGEEEALKAGKDRPGGVEFLLTDRTGMPFEKDPTVKEAHTIARRILALLKEKDERGNPKYGPGDICILLRNLARNAKTLEHVLRGYGIDAHAPSDQQTTGPEIDVFVNFLQIVDSFSSDIALLSVMRSHIGGFNEAELAAIRGHIQADAFSACLFAYARETGPLPYKCNAFLEKIQKYRVWSHTLLTEDLLLLLKNETEYSAYLHALPGGKEKAQRFADFFENCLSYSREQDGLYALLHYLEAVKKEMGAYSSAEKAQNGGYIPITSIHGSKGLEFPVVILARTATRFNGQDSSKSILLHPVLGIASDRIDEKRRTKMPTLIKDMLRYVLDKEQKSEELRLLYVAMTRAKERLILSGAVRKPEKFFSSLSGRARWYELLSMDTMLKWLVCGVLDLPCMADWRGKEEEKGGIQVPHRIETAFAGRGEEAGSPTIRDILLDAGEVPYLPFLRYPEQNVPVKLGVSALLPEDEIGVSIPAYTFRKDAGAELGSLIHLFLQHVDLGADTLANIEETADAMEKKLLLGSREKQRILGFAPEILDFLKSDIARRARSSKRLLREVPFSLLVSAKEIGIADTEENVMLQGIMDMVFEEPGGWILVDYKSNMTDEAGIQSLARKYGIQIKMYEKAVQAITGKPVKESWLWFLRIRNKFRVF